MGSVTQFPNKEKDTSLLPAILLSLSVFAGGIIVGYYHGLSAGYDKGLDNGFNTCMIKLETENE